MSGLSPLDLAILVVGLGVAGFAKGLTGMGLPVVATPILAGVFGPRAAVLIVTIPILASNTLLMLPGWRRPEMLRGLLPVIVAGIVGTLIGVNLLAYLDQRTFAILISVMVAVFLLRGDRLLGEDPDARRARLLGPVVGLAGGMLQGTTSISSPLLGSYFHALRLSPADFVLVLAVLFEINSIVQIAGYAALGLYTAETVAIGVLGLVPALLALMLGIYLRSRLDHALFRRLVVILLVASVVNLLWRSFAG